MYVEEFKENIDIAKEFSGCDRGEGEDKYRRIFNLLEESYIYLAWYDCGSYSGTAWVIFKNNGKLYEVHGSHCSCYGLEDQWDPEETSWEVIRKRILPQGRFYEEIVSEERVSDYIRKLCDAQIGRTK